MDYIYSYIVILYIAASYIVSSALELDIGLICTCIYNNYIHNNTLIMLEEYMYISVLVL